MGDTLDNPDQVFSSNAHMLPCSETYLNIIPVAIDLITEGNVSSKMYVSLCQMIPGLQNYLFNSTFDDNISHIVDLVCVF